MSSSSPEGATRSEAVRVWLLGGFRVSVGSRTIRQDEWRLRKAAALVKLLALAPNHRLHREQAMEVLWPDSRRRAASNSLRKALHSARRTLDPAAGYLYLASEDESLVLRSSGDLWVDTEAFEEAAARRSQDPASYRMALELYAGDLLPEDRYEEWTQERREQLRRLYLDLLVELARLQEGRGEHGPAIEALRSAVALEPTSVQAHAYLMRLRASHGQRGEALAQYERLRETLQRKLGTGPDASVRALREEIATDRFLRSERPSADAAREEPPDGGRHNLPAQRSSFVGRDRELIEIRRALAMTRLLTLTGAGGSGKTRLALEFARELIGTYQEGVWLVELAPLSESVPQAVAGALGVSERSGETLIDTLVDHLRRKQALLVLDNCEHVVEATARLADVLLSSCPGLRILATSREALNVVGEVVWPVPTLSVPEPERSPTADELEGFESVRLFLERASERRPGFALVPDDARPVAEICRTLEGMPLAIELAAATVRTLSVGQISERLANSLGLLTGGSRTVTPRQRTLRGALDWSHDLLSGPEKVLFRRLSVFAGGWTLEAAEAVVFGRGVEQSEVLALLSELIEKSLVVVEATKENEIRYRLLEPIRQYAREKLEDGEEIWEIQHRHAEYFSAFAEVAEVAFPGPDEAWWLDRLRVEYDNLTAALSWLLDDEDHVPALRLATALWPFWRSRGRLGEGAGWLKEALARSDRSEPPIRAGALYGLGDILTEQGHLGEAQAYLEEALALYETQGNRRRTAEALASLGWIVLYRNDIRKAEAFFKEAVTAGRHLETWKDMPRILRGLVWCALEEGDVEQARALCGEALALHRKQGEVLGAATALNQMGYIELAWGNLERATVLFEEALTLGRGAEHELTIAIGLWGLGMISNLRGDPKLAKTLLKESLLLYLELERKAEIAEYLEAFAEASGALGQEAWAARLWGKADAMRGASRPWNRAERMMHEPLLAAARSRTDEAVWEAAFAEGQAMEPEEAVQYVLSEAEGDVGASSTSAPEQPSADTVPSLTPREREIAALVARGLTNRQIAADLTISEHTAATHVRRILRKLGLYSRAELAGGKK